MRLPFLKDKPDDVAGVMFSHVIGFLDGAFPSSDGRLSLPEAFLLSDWLQIVCIGAAGGGATKRVMTILDAYSEQVLKRSLRWFVQTGRLEESVEAVRAFQGYIVTHAETRRNEYDAVFRSAKPPSMLLVAQKALTHIIASRSIGGPTALDVGQALHSTYHESVRRFQGML